MSWSLISSVTQGFGIPAGSGGTTAAIDTTGADLIVIVESYYAGGTAPAVSDSKSNTWNALTLSNEGTPACRIYYAAGGGILVGSGHTFTLTTADAYPAIAVLAFSGAGASPADGENGAVTSGATALSTGNVTPSQDGDLLIAGMAWDQSISNLAIDSGLGGMITTSYMNFGWEGVAAAYLEQGAAAAINPQWTWTTSVKAAARLAAFKGPGAAGQPAVKRMGGVQFAHRLRGPQYAAVW